MIGRWKFTAITLVLLAVLSGLGVCCAGLLSAPDRFVISLVMTFSVSCLGTFGLVVCFYLKLRRGLRIYLNRLPLSDEEFAEFLASEVHIDLDVVQKVRQLAANRFWSLRSECFYPGDRLKEDLHLADVAPYALEDFWDDLEDCFGAVESDTAQKEIATFGDVVLEANRRRRNRTHAG
jgi:hypothetical protein